MILISLIGEHPIPNLLPIRHQPPEIAVLVYSDFTEKAARRLGKLLPRGCQVELCPVSAYDIAAAKQQMLGLVATRGWGPASLLFNLTGGTKPMSLAAYLVAAELRAPFLYLQSEGKQTRLYRYEFDALGVPHVATDELLPNLITIDDYLRAFVDEYQLTGIAKDESSKGTRFERAIHTALEPVVDEIAVGLKLLGVVDVDFVVRCANQVGIIEAKTGSGVKKGIDQLSTAGEQRNLGTYTQKLLVSDQVWDHTLSNLRELADARRIEVIELPSFSTEGSLSVEDGEKLTQRVCKSLGRP
jgi:hypothetical protein